MLDVFARLCPNCTGECIMLDVFARLCPNCTGECIMLDVFARLCPNCTGECIMLDVFVRLCPNCSVWACMPHWLCCSFYAFSALCNTALVCQVLFNMVPV